MAMFSPFMPWYRGDSWLDDLEDHPFVNLNSSVFQNANIARANRANVSETETEYLVELEAPGYQKTELNIEFGSDGKSLIITGRTEKSYEEGEGEEGEEEEKGEKG